MSTEHTESIQTSSNDQTSGNNPELALNQSDNTEYSQPEFQQYRLQGLSLRDIGDSKLDLLGFPNVQIEDSLLPIDVNLYEQVRLRQLGMTHNELMSVKLTVNAEAREPADFLVSLVKEPELRILGIGLPPYQGDEIFSSGLMQRLCDGGATHVALAVDQKYQSNIDRFLESGNMDDLADVRSAVLMDLLPTLIAAHEAGLKIVAVQDDSSASFDERNRSMAAGVNNLIETDERAKVVFIAGRAHLSSHRQDPTAVDLLRDEFGDDAVKTVTMPAREEERNDPLLFLTRDLNEAVIVPTREPNGEPNNIGQLSRNFLQPTPYTYDKNLVWDYVFIPRKSSEYS